MATYRQVTCVKCGGKGNIPAFGHIAGGTCFACAGNGYVTVRVKSELELKREAAKRKAKEAVFAARQAEYNRKLEVAYIRYENDKRIPEGRNIRKLSTLVYELAVKDGVWDTL